MRETKANTLRRKRDRLLKEREHAHLLFWDLYDEGADTIYVTQRISTLDGAINTVDKKLGVPTARRA